MTKKSICFQPAFLWDGSHRLAGKIELKPDVLVFHSDSFKDSNLELRILIERITHSKLYKLYDLETSGIEIMDNSGRSNIFIMKEPEKLNSLLNKVLT